MTVTCAECGEELLGSVNRCWKCGTEFASLPDADALPPVRRVPPAQIAVTAEVEAEVTGVANEADTPDSQEVENEDSGGADSDGGADTTAEPQPASPPVRTVANVETDVSPTAVKPFAAHPVKDGSPFAGADAAPLIAPATRPALRPSYPRNAASVGGAYASLSLGVLSLLGALLLPNFPLGPILTSVFGLAMGAWGLYSKHRLVAAIGLLLCCIALGLAGFFGAVKLYEMIHGVSPFATDPGVDGTTGLPIVE